MSFEIIAGLAVLILGAIAGAFGIGHARGTSKAEAKAELQRTEENAAGSVAAAERKAEVTKEASNVQQTVSHMPDDDVDRETARKLYPQNLKSSTLPAIGYGSSTLPTTISTCWISRPSATFCRTTNQCWRTARTLTPLRDNVIASPTRGNRGKKWQKSHLQNRFA